MKNTLLIALAFAFVGLTGCASEETTEITTGEDTTSTMPVEPIAPAPMPMDTMMTDTTGATGTETGTGTGTETGMDTTATGAGQ